MEKELLQQALNSILHGSTSIVSDYDGNGNVVQRTVQVNDLRLPLVAKIAEKLVQTPEYREALVKAFTPEVINKIQENITNTMNFSNLDYDTQRKLQNAMKETPLEIKSYKLVAEVINKD